MDLKALTQIDIQDLKNIDLSQIKDRIFGRPDIFIILIIVAITLSASIFIYTNQSNQAKALKKEAKELKEKLKIVNSLKANQKDYNNFIEGLPEGLDADRLIDKISGFAIAHDIQIQTFSPAKEKSNAFAKLINVKINVSAKNYKDIIRFTRDLESAEYSIRLKEWAGKLDARTRLTTAEGKPMSNIDATIVIESLLIKQ